MFAHHPHPLMQIRASHERPNWAARACRSAYGWLRCVAQCRAHAQDALATPSFRRCSRSQVGSLPTKILCSPRRCCTQRPRSHAPMTLLCAAFEGVYRTATITTRVHLAVPFPPNPSPLTHDQVLRRDSGRHLFHCSLQDVPEESVKDVSQG